MGRIKTQLVKRTTVHLLNLHGGQFGEDFAANKAMVNRYVSVFSHKLRNNVAGYITRLVRMRKAKGV
ncbi:TPA: 30S ribosomal protein S17e [Candidatus Woesearchaeota archaeon]|nr:30S ribosomal protein S17e [Candidatus Woesearchaeota archaeon]